MCDHWILVLPCCFLGCWMNSCIGTYPSLPSIGASWFNPCSGCLCLWELFLVCSVLSLPVSRGATEVSLGLFSHPAFLVCSLGSLCAVTGCASEFLSCSSLCSCSLCFKDPLRLWGIGVFGGRAGLVTCRICSV